jgi:MFS family permease
MRAIVLLSGPLLPYVCKVRALRVISVAFLTAIVGGVLAVVASLYLTKLYQVSDFEGGGGMLIFFALAPLGLIVGFIIGLVVALVTRADGFRGFVKAQGVAVGSALALAAIGSAVLYLVADHPPKLGGKSLALEFELKIPTALKLPAEASVQTLHASLYANNRDNHFATLDYDKIAKRDGYIFVPGKASLLSQTSNRNLLVSVESDGGASQFIKLNLRANPRKEDEVWSDWITAKEQADLSPGAGGPKDRGPLPCAARRVAQPPFL